MKQSLPRPTTGVLAFLTLFTALASISPLVAAPPATPAGAALIEPADAIPGQPGYTPSDWALAANHVHSSTGIGFFKPKGIRKIVANAKKYGIDMVVVTDHNTVAHWFDPSFQESSDVVLARGEEWTSEVGHANILGYEAEGPDDAIVPCDWEHSPEPCEDGVVDYGSMVEEVHDRGGIVIVNHPALKRHIFPEDDFGADAVEVNRNLTDIYGRGGRAWWHRRLVEGSRLAGVGGCDWHFWKPGSDPELAGRIDCPSNCGHAPGGLGRLEYGGQLVCLTGYATMRAWPVPSFTDSTNLVRVESRDEAGLFGAFRKRHVMMRQKMDGPLVFLGVDNDGDGSFEDYRAGDEVPANGGEEGQPLRFQARVLNGHKEDLRVILSWASPTGGRVEAIREIQVRGDDFAYAFTVPRGAPGSSFVRLEIGTKGAAVTNPVFF